MTSFAAPWLVDASLRASIVILFILCLRPALRRWIGNRALAWLWLAVAARLLFPMPLAAPWHAPSLFGTARSDAAAAPSVFHVSVSTVDTSEKPGAGLSRHQSATVPANAAPNLLFLLWLSGALLAMARLGRGWWTARRWAVYTVSADIHPGLMSVYQTIPVDLRRGVALRLTDALDVPTLVGVLRPQIWLPRTFSSAFVSAELRHILLHELGHVHRRDLLAQWLCELACCIHWFNPLVWLSARLARTDRELACDAWVLSHDSTQAGDPAAYGHTLLRVVEGMRHRAARTLPLVSMAAGKRHVGLRVQEISTFRLVAPWRGVAALVVTTALVAVCTLGGTAAEDEASLAGPAAPVATTSPVPAPDTPTGASPGSVVPASPAPNPSVRSHQVEIETKFIEIDKSIALKLEKSVPRSSPLASVFHQVLAPSETLGSSTPRAIFRSSPVLPDNYQLLIRQINQTKGADFLSAPRVTAKSGQKATIEIIREFIYPTAFQHDKSPSNQPLTTPTNFDKMNTGLTLEVTPVIEPTGEVIDLSLTWKITEFDGFVNADGRPVPLKSPGVQFPVFDTRSISTVVVLSSGASVVFSMDGQHPSFQRSLQFAMGKKEREMASEIRDGRLVLVTVTATLVDPPSASPTQIEDAEEKSSAREKSQQQTAYRPPSHPLGLSSTKPSVEPSVDAASLPYGVPVPGKPGFLISPYAPDAGQVDLRGFKPGQSVRDPYTGKMFLVP